MKAPRFIAALFTLAACAACAWAQDPAAIYPNRPIRFVVPYPPGALTDVLARVIGERLATALKQPVVVENRAGAGTLPYLIGRLARVDRLPHGVRERVRNSEAIFAFK